MSDDPQLPGDQSPADEYPEIAGVAPAERAALVRLAERLERERPVHRPGYRSQLRRQILERSSTARVAGRLRVAIAAYSSGGLALLLAATFGVAGIGPLAP